MPVRKTESRIPANFQAGDLGQAVVSADGRCALVAFVTSPIVVNRENIYVLIISDPGLAAVAEYFEWTFELGELAPESRRTTYGEVAYQPPETGFLTLIIKVFDIANSEQAKLVLTQDVVSPSMELEAIIAEAVEQPGPGAMDPIALRELVNEYARYYQTASINVSEGDDGFSQFLFRVAFYGVSRRPSTRRNQQLRDLAAAINGQDVDFAMITAEGIGICGIRLLLLAMTLPTPSSPVPIINWTELPEAANQRGFIEEQLREKLSGVGENSLIDLFNVVRFPKSNIVQCGNILKLLRDRYFSGTTFQEAMEGLSGTRAHWILRHYIEGPILRR